MMTNLNLNLTLNQQIVREIEVTSRLIKPLAMIIARYAITPYDAFAYALQRGTFAFNIIHNGDVVTFHVDNPEGSQSVRVTITRTGGYEPGLFDFADAHSCFEWLMRPLDKVGHRFLAALEE
jgi:hypothetical protein